MSINCNYISIKIVIIVSVLFLFPNCVNSEKETDNGVECRLYWIGDSYPQKTENMNENEFRMISLHYIIINNTLEEYFLPIKKSISYDKVDSEYSSEMIASIDKKYIDTWFSADVRWNSILKPGDSIRANLKIPERILDNKKMELLDLLHKLELKYIRRLSDTVYNTYKIPQLYFTNNDTIAIHYKDTMAIFKMVHGTLSEVKR